MICTRAHYDVVININTYLININTNIKKIIYNNHERMCVLTNSFTSVYISIRMNCFHVAGLWSEIVHDNPLGIMDSLFRELRLPQHPHLPRLEWAHPNQCHILQTPPAK